MKETVARWQDQIKLRYRKLFKRAQARWAARPSFGTLRIAVVAVGAFVLIAMVYLAQASNAALVARDLRNKHVKILELERENSQLRYEIAALASPSAIEQRARKLGLAPAKKVVYAEMPWIQPPANELMPAFLPSTVQDNVPQTFNVTDSTVLEQVLSVLGLGTLSDQVNAQTLK